MCRSIQLAVLEVRDRSIFIFPLVTMLKLFNAVWKFVFLIL